MASSTSTQELSGAARVVILAARRREIIAPDYTLSGYYGHLAGRKDGCTDKGEWEIKSEDMDLLLGASVPSTTCTVRDAR